jgi:putative membrane protein
VSETAITANPSARARGIRRGIALAAVVLVPLAFTGVFVGALANADDRLDAIPAVIVNDDEMVTQTADDGTETPILAGRQLVTELTGDGQTGFDWQISNDEDAAEMLASGDAYAVLTIPEGFSKSIVSLQGDDPRQAAFAIATDDAHSYIGGAVAQVVASTLKTEFGSAITEQYISGLFTGLSAVGASLADAADGADQLGDGADELTDGAEQLTDGIGQLGTGADTLAGGTDELATGLGKLAKGASSAASGADDYVDGVKKYTAGVGQLSDGLGQLAKGDDALDQISSGVTTYTQGVSQASSGLDQLNQAIQANPAVDARTKGAVQELAGGLDQLAASGPALASGATQGIDGIQSGISQSAEGAATLDSSGSALTKGGRKLANGLDDLASGAKQSANGTDQLAGGAHELADGIDQLEDGSAQLADGSSQLADGTHKLADGLASGAKQAPSYTAEEADETAGIIADPVTYSTTTDNQVTTVGQAIATYFVPVGLWLGALAVFLVTRPLSRRALASTAPNGRLAFRVIARAFGVTLLQAVLLVVLQHAVLDVPWTRIGETLPFAALMALAFTAIHAFLTLAFGRIGFIISLVLLAVQMTSTGGIYPLQLVAEPFQVISPYLPVTYGVSGMQAIISGGSAGPIVTASVVLAVFAILGVLLSFVALRRSRRATSMGLLPAPSPTA